MFDHVKLKKRKGLNNSTSAWQITSKDCQPDTQDKKSSFATKIPNNIFVSNTKQVLVNTSSFVVKKPTRMQISIHDKPENIKIC